jgi:hypothetical protein
MHRDNKYGKPSEVLTKTPEFWTASNAQSILEYTPFRFEQILRQLNGRTAARLKVMRWHRRLHFHGPEFTCNFCFHDRAYWLLPGHQETNVEAGRSERVLRENEIINIVMK